MGSVILAVAPHPDDAEIGVGGALAKFAAEGHTVVVVDLTDGEPTPCGSPEIRFAESEKATAILGVIRERLDIRNREIYDTPENRKKLAAIYRKWRPEILLVPLWEDAHPDHVHACQLAEASRFYAKFVKTEMPGDPWYPRKVLHYFATHHRTKVAPSFILDITSSIEKKMASIAAYHSQFSANPANLTVLTRLREESAWWGSQVGVAYGEPYVCREPIRLSSAEAFCGV